jgi:hypothetical protein
VRAKLRRRDAAARAALRRVLDGRYDVPLAIDDADVADHRRKVLTVH